MIYLVMICFIFVIRATLMLPHCPALLSPCSVALLLLTLGK